MFIFENFEILFYLYKKANSPLEKSAESRNTSRERRGKQHSLHQGGGNTLVNNFQDFLKMRIALGKDFSEKKETSKKTADDLKKALNQLPLFKLPKHPNVDSKEKIKFTNNHFKSKKLEFYSKEIENKSKEISKKK